MEEGIEDTRLYRSKLQNRILRELWRESLRLAGRSEIPEFPYNESAKKWNVPDKIMARVIQEIIDKCWVEELTDGYVSLTPKGREECRKIKFDT